MNDTAPNMTPRPTKDYSKRPIWQWVVLYIIIAVIAYGLIYYFLNGSSVIDQYGY